MITQIQYFVDTIDIPADFKQFEYSDKNITKVEEDILERRKKELAEEKMNKAKFIE